MALQRDARYPGRWTAPSAGHPQGAFKNRTAPGSLDGSYIEQDWANDWDGYFSSLLGAAGLTANGTVDAVGASQYFTALQAVVRATATGRLLNTQTFTSNGTYTPTPGTNKIRVRACGGGSSGNGVPVGSAGVISGGSGGGAGSFAEAIYTSGFSGLLVTIGAGGVGVANGQTVGGTTSLGGLLSCPGGGAGGVLQIATSGVVLPTQQGIGGTIPTGSGIIFASEGACGASTLLFGTINDGLVGMGATTPFGGGSPNTSIGGVPGRGYGSGGSGSISRNGSAAQAGGNGKGGILIIDEYT